MFRRWPKKKWTDGIQKIINLLEVKTVYIFAKDSEEGGYILLKKSTEMLIINTTIEIRIISSK